MVLVITQHNLPEPSTDIGVAIMHPALKLNLNGFKLRNHSLFRSNPPYGEGSALVALPTMHPAVQIDKPIFYPGFISVEDVCALNPGTVWVNRSS